MPSSSSSSAGAATSVIPDEIRTRVEELLGVTNVEPPSQLTTWYNNRHGGNVRDGPSAWDVGYPTTALAADQDTTQSVVREKIDDGTTIREEQDVTNQECWDHPDVPDCLDVVATSSSSSNHTNNDNGQQSSQQASQLTLKQRIQLRKRTSMELAASTIVVCFIVVAATTIDVAREK